MRLKMMNRDGFTMVEMMIVVAVIGLLAILTIPGYQRFMANWKLKGESEALAATLRTARSAAVMKNIDVVFTFDLDAQEYTWFEDEDGSGTRSANEYLSSTRELPPQVRIAAHTLSNPVLTFGSKGNTRESGSITLRNTNNDIKDIVIFSGTGNVTID